ncbi:MAG: hypothetical protein ACJA0N_002408, partial [Pseudohongiellaceae bacterium]
MLAGRAKPMLLRPLQGACDSWNSRLFLHGHRACAVITRGETRIKTKQIFTQAGPASFL